MENSHRPIQLEAQSLINAENALTIVAELKSSAFDCQRNIELCLCIWVREDECVFQGLFGVCVWHVNC